jgi:hypothetical protein
MSALTGQDDELGNIDRIDPLAQHGALRASLTTVFDEYASILERHIDGKLAQGLPRRQIRTATCEHVADRALRNARQRADMNPELEGRKEMNATAKHMRLEAGGTVEGYKALFQRATQAPQFLNDPNRVIADEYDNP